MKNLTKLIVIAILLAFTTKSFSQTNFGIKAGLNLSNATYKSNDETYSDNFKSKLGFQLGPVVEFRFSHLISLETGLLLSTKGYKSEVSESDFGTEWKSEGSVNILYLSIPANVRAGFDVGSMRIYGAVGPYIGIGLSGKVKWEYTSDGITESGDESIEFGNDADDSDLKRFDYGLSFGAGAVFGAFEVGLNYDLGLANISSYTDNGTKASNKTFSITAAFKFGK